MRIKLTKVLNNKHEKDNIGIISVGEHFLFEKIMDFILRQVPKIMGVFLPNIWLGVKREPNNFGFNHNNNSNHSPARVCISRTSSKFPQSVTVRSPERLIPLLSLLKLSSTALLMYE
jgi:hypothetical protein